MTRKNKIAVGEDFRIAIHIAIKNFRQTDEQKGKILFAHKLTKLEIVLFAFLAEKYFIFKYFLYLGVWD